MSAIILVAVVYGAGWWFKRRYVTVDDLTAYEAADVILGRQTTSRR